MSRTAAPVPRPPTIAFPESALGQFDFAATFRTSTLLLRFLLQSYRWVYLSSACSSFSKNMLTLSGLTMRIHAGLPKGHEDSSRPDRTSQRLEGNSRVDPNHESDERALGSTSNP